jgi:hypothetical protein
VTLYLTTEDGATEEIKALSPVVENVDFIGDGNARGDEVAKGADDVVGLHVFGDIAFVVDEKDTRMGTTLRLPIIVELWEIIRVSGQQSVTMLRSIIQMVRVIPVMRADVARRDHGVTRVAQQDDEKVRVEAIVEVDRQGH